MKSYSLSHLADPVLLRDLSALVARERSNTAELLAHLAEVDRRRLYAGFDCDSMHAYCELRLGLSADSAARRIQAARTAREFPAIFAMLADGRLHLTAICLLAPYLPHCDPEALLVAASHRTKREVLELLAERFPRPDVATSLVPLAMAPPLGSPATAPAPLCPANPVAGAPPVTVSGPAHAPAHVAPAITAKVAGPMVPLPPRATLVPLSPGHELLRATLDAETVDLLRRAQALLGHALPTGDLVPVLKRVLQDWVRANEARKYGLTEKPRVGCGEAKGRHIPAAIRRAVLERDGARCTFTSPDGRRCASRTRLEYDHVTPVAKGGRTCVENLRLLCRTHNQHQARLSFGVGFMQRKLEGARRGNGLERSAAPTPSARSARAAVPRDAPRARR